MLKKWTALLSSHMSAIIEDTSIERAILKVPRVSFAGSPFFALRTTASQYATRLLMIVPTA